MEFEFEMDYESFAVSYVGEITSFLSGHFSKVLLEKSCLNLPLHPKVQDTYICFSRDPDLQNLVQESVIR